MMSQKQKYDKNPKFCKQCKKKIEFKQKLSVTLKKEFCSLGCAASYGNMHGPLRRKKMYFAKEWSLKIKDAISKNNSMATAAQYLGLEFKTFRKMAKELKYWVPNPSGRGTSKSKYPIEDVFSNKVYVRPQDLKKRLIALKIKQEKCEVCNISEWQGRKAPLELHHIDGQRENNALENVMIICPNCHAQTDNYKGKNKNKRK
jgi:hypothetical protein